MGASPTFADIDHDGDLDALIGNFNGDTLYFENTGSATAPAFAAPVTNPFGLADVGQTATPTFVDIDGGQPRRVDWQPRWQYRRVFKPIRPKLWWL
ncbi:MAG: VCBS repeat-containing protein [Methylovulum sp.]|nr:VCBS repeat-containing protein [Methylovulum sp.]